MTQIGSAYGEALYALAKEEGLSQPILEQLSVLEQCFEAEPDYLKLLSAASVPKQERTRILDEAFSKTLQPYLLNFLKILAEKGYIRHFPHCCTAYRRCYYEDNGILPVTAVSAVALNGAQTKRLTEKLTAITGKTILLSNQVEPELLGGLRLDFDGKQLDDTIRHRLESIRQMLKNTVL